MNLISSAGVTLGFWDGGDTALHDDGSVQGGDGVWSATSRNWTGEGGALNGSWNQDFAIFGGAAGTVTVDTAAGAVNLSGMQFMTDGYVVTGDTLTATAAETIIRTDAGITATIAADIAGTGGIVKTDTGTLILSGANTYTGGTTIRSGGLVVNGSLGGSVLVETGARLSGTGTVGTTTIAGGGAIAPGNSIGMLNVAGDITFVPGSIYEVDVDPAGTASDRIAASGRAILNGGSVLHVGLDGGYQPLATYTILTAAGGVEGQFDDVASDFAFLDPTLGYSADAVTLTLARNDIGFPDVAQTLNQCETAAGAEELGFGSTIFDTIVALDAEGARGAFDILSGEIYASLHSVLVQDSRFVRAAALDRMRQAGAASDAEPGLRLWMQGMGSWGAIDGDGNARRISHDAAGLLIGLDAIAGEQVQLGMFGGYQHGNANVRAAGSKADIDSYHAGLYAGLDRGGLGLRAGYAFSWHKADVRRQIAFADFADSTRADFDASTAQALGEIAYRFDVGATRIEPFAQIAHVSIDSERLQERGGAAVLRIAHEKAATNFSTIGARVEQSFSAGPNGTTLRAAAGWRHAFGDRVPVVATSFVGSSPFSIAGTPIARNALSADLGVSVALSSRARLDVSYIGDIASYAENHYGRATLSWRF